LIIPGFLFLVTACEFRATQVTTAAPPPPPPVPAPAYAAPLPPEPYVAPAPVPTRSVTRRHRAPSVSAGAGGPPVEIRGEISREISREDIAIASFPLPP